MSEERRKEDRASVDDWRGDKSKKNMRASVEATAHMKDYYKQRADRLAHGEPSLWVYTRLPWILFNSMDLVPIDTIHYGALASAKQMSRYYLDRLNEQGYFRDLCRYCTVTLGYVFDKKPEIAPWGGLPKPQAIIGLHNDDPAVKIWELYAREFNVPMYFVERTYASRVTRAEYWWEDLIGPDAEVEPHRVDVMAEDLRGLIRFLETTTGKLFSETKLREFMRRRNEEHRYRDTAFNLAQSTRPCPISWADTMADIAAFRLFQGTEWGHQHAREFYLELKDRVEKHMAVVENERVRLLWNGISIWYTPGFYSAFEERYGAVFLPGRMPPGTIYGERTNIDDPLRALASSGISDFLENLPPTKSKWLVYLSQKYSIHGVVFGVAESCKLLYTGILFARSALEKAGIPSLEINADMVDARDWDDMKMKSLVSNFIETIMS